MPLKTPKNIYKAFIFKCLYFYLLGVLHCPTKKYNLAALKIRHTYLIVEKQFSYLKAVIVTNLEAIG